jgi:hypothetical protein
MTARADAPAPAGTLGRLAPVMSSLGLIGVVCATVVQFPMHGADDWARRLLETALLWLIGVEGRLIGFGHLVSPDRIADFIGWKNNPFQFEVGLASVSYGVLGVLATRHGHERRSATIDDRGVLDLLPRGGRRSRPGDRFQGQPRPRRRGRGPRPRHRRSDPSDCPLRAYRAS